MKSFIALLVVVCVLVGGAQASDSCNGADFGTAGDFSFYVFSQTWSALFCASSSHSQWPGCKNPTTFMQHNMTIHGLWPNYDQSRSGHNWPQCCPSSTPDISQKTFDALADQFHTYWPNEKDPTPNDLQNSLWEHEWNKHGTCSGLDQVTYFQSALKVGYKIGTPDLVGRNIGGTVDRDSLQRAMNNGDTCTSGQDCLVGVACNGSQFEGFTSCWDKNLRQMVCPAAVFAHGPFSCPTTINIKAY